MISLVGESVEGDVVEGPAEALIVGTQARVERVSSVDVDGRVDGDTRDQQACLREILVSLLPPPS